jgi:hypothetical protein
MNCHCTVPQDVRAQNHYKPLQIVRNQVLSEKADKKTAEKKGKKVFLVAIALPETCKHRWYTKDGGKHP